MLGYGYDINPYYEYFRHEMEHFVHFMQGYLSNQIIHVTWLEFKQSLDKDVHNLDDLHDRHAEYLRTSAFRSVFIMYIT